MFVGNLMVLRQFFMLQAAIAAAIRSFVMVVSVWMVWSGLVVHGVYDEMSLAFFVCCCNHSGG